MPSILEQINGALADIEGLVMPSLVQIRSGRHGVGSGAVWRSDGLILTNAHVVRRGPVTVQTNAQTEYEAHILARDPQQDIALVQIPAVNLPALTMGDSSQLHAGDIVIAFGRPWGVPGAATSGIVIGAGEDLPEWRNSPQQWLAASLHLRPGHSGGPMVNVQGQLVGINTMMNGPDVGIAAPINVVKEFLAAKWAQF
ncbi:MAG: trypsin-like peptidase domain-containing protein [Caldilineaceae bacterium]